MIIKEKKSAPLKKRVPFVATVPQGHCFGALFSLSVKISFRTCCDGFSILKKKKKNEMFNENVNPKPVKKIYFSKSYILIRSGIAIPVHFKFFKVHPREHKSREKTMKKPHPA